MRKIIFSSIALLAFSTFMASAQQTTAAVSPSNDLGLKAGQKYGIETTSKVNSSAEAMGQKIENNVDVTTTTVYEVVSTADGGATLKATKTKIKTVAAIMGQEMEYDSEKNDNSGPMAEAIQGSLNKPRKVVIDNKGNITEQDEDTGGAMNAAIGMASAGPAKVIDMYIPILMGRELKVGDIIDDAINNTAEKYQSKESGSYKITAVENGIISISYSGTQEINATIEQMGMEMTTTSNNTVKSELQIDQRTRMVLIKATAIDGNMSIDAGGMTIPATNKTTVTIKVSLLN